MAIFLITHENIEYVKAALRQTFPGVRSAHRIEAFATALGYRTYAALLADLRPGEQFPAIASVSQLRFSSRLAELGYPGCEMSELAQIVRSPDLPHRPWAVFKNGDLSANNRWYRECQRRDIPNVRIETRTKLVELSWDCISQDNRHDDTRGTEHLDAMFARFQKRSYPSSTRPIFFGSAFVGSIDRLLPEVAMDIADEIFKVLMEPIERERASRAA